jgi:hypothetical protein
MPNTAYSFYHLVKSIFNRLIEPVKATSDEALSTANTALTTANNAISGLPVTDLSTTIVNATISGTAKEIGRVKLTIGSTTTAILAGANIVFVNPSNAHKNIKAYLDINSGLQPEQNITTGQGASGHFTNATLSHRVLSNASVGEKNIRVWAYVPDGTTITISSISVWAIGHLVNA